MIENDEAVRSYTVTAVPVTLKTPQYWTSSDIVVYDVDSDGNGSFLTLGTHYTVSGSGAEDGGTLSLTSRVNSGTSTIVVICDPGREQEVDYIRNDDFPADTHETALDKLTRMVQICREYLSRTPSFPLYDTATVTDITKDSRKNKLLGFDSTGKVELTSRAQATYQSGNRMVFASVSALTTEASITSVSSGDVVLLTGYYAAGDFGAPIELVVEASTGGVKSHTLSDGRYANLYADGPINVKWFGAKGDSTGVTGNGTDDTAAIQLALDTGTYGLGCEVGTPIYFPKGKYRTTDTLFAGWPSSTGGFWTTRIIGDPGSKVSQKPSDIGVNSLIFGDFASAKKNRPILTFENQRGSLLQWMGVVGNMDSQAVDGLSYDDKMGIDLTDETVWIDSDTAARTADQRRYTPWCAICFSGYGANKVNGSYSYPTFSIPSYLTSKIGSTFGNGNPSSNGVLRDWGCGYADVGIVWGPNESNNTDQYTIDSFNIKNCCYGISTSQANQRMFRPTNGYIQWCYVGATDTTHGAQSGQMIGLSNVEIDYCMYGIFSGVIGFSGERLMFENTVSVGQFTSATLDIHRLNSWDHYQNFNIPLIEADNSLYFKHLEIEIVRSDVTGSSFIRHYYDAPTIPWIYADQVTCENFYMFENRRVSDFDSCNDSFLADIEDAPATTVAEENKIIHAVVHRLLPGVLVIPKNGNKPFFHITGGYQALTAGGNYGMRQGNWSIGAGGALGGATFDQRKVVPIGAIGIYQTDSHEQHQFPSGMSHRPRPELDWDDITLSEVTQAITMGSTSFTIRKVYADIVTAVPNTLATTLIKGDILTLRASASDTPQTFVIVQGPKDVVDNGIAAELHSGTAAAGGASTITLDAGASGTDSFYNGHRIEITGGTGAGQIKYVSGYVGATKVATVESAWTTPPDATSTFQIIHAYTFRARCISGFRADTAYASGIPTYPSTTSYPTVQAFYRPYRSANPYRGDMYLNFSAGSNVVTVEQDGGGADIDLTKLLRRNDEIWLIDNDYIIGATTYSQGIYPSMRVKEVQSASQFTVFRNALKTGTARVLIT